MAEGVVTGMASRVDGVVPSSGSTRHVFISHVEENADVALAIANGLEEAGYNTWCYERDALPGPSYLLQTARQIEDSAAVVLLISPSSLGSQQVTAEVVRAHESGRPFIPVLIDISHAEFAARQPEWREALGSSTSISLPDSDVSTILPRILLGLAGLGIMPIEGHEARLSTPYVLPASPAVRTPGRRRSPGPALVAVAVAVVALLGAAIAFAGSGGDGGDGAEQASSPTSATATTGSPPSTVPSSEASTTSPAPSATSSLPTAPTAPIVTSPAPQATAPPPLPATTAVPTTIPAPAPSPAPAPAPGVASADETPVATSAGAMDVLDASLVEEWCSFDGDCLTASGAQRYLVLVPAGGDAPRFDGTFTAQASQSSVAFAGGTAGTAKVSVDQEMEMAEIVYGMVPSSALSGDITLHWPGNPALELTVF